MRRLNLVIMNWMENKTLIYAHNSCRLLLHHKPINLSVPHIDIDISFIRHEKGQGGRSNVTWLLFRT